MNSTAGTRTGPTYLSEAELVGVDGQIDEALLLKLRTSNRPDWIIKRRVVTAETFQRVVEDARGTRSLVSFRHCRFLDPLVIASRFAFSLEFKECVFDRRLDFASTTFERDFRIRRCQVADLSMDRVRFDAEAKFTDTDFRGSASFRSSHFAERANFDGTRFGGPLSFDECEFDSDLHMSRTSFDNKWTTFKRARMGTACTLRNSTGRGKLSFDEVTFSGPLTLELGAPETVIRNCVITEPVTVLATGDSTQLSGICNCTLTESMTIGARTRLTACSFARSTGLENLRFRGDPGWPLAEVANLGGSILSTRRCLRDDLSGDLDAIEVEGLYRQIRRALESSGAYSEAGDFFYGEMLSRRRHLARKSASSAGGISSDRSATSHVEEILEQNDPATEAEGSVDWADQLTTSLGRRSMAERMLLALYGWIGGYGVRPLRPFVALVVVLVGVTVKLRLDVNGFFSPNPGTDLGSAGPENVNAGLDRFGDLFAFVLRNSFSFFRPTTDGLEWQGSIVLFLTRVVSIGLTGLILLGLRAKVRR